jgi:hypothetical protein
VEGAAHTVCVCVVQFRREGAEKGLRFLGFRVLGRTVVDVLLQGGARLPHQRPEPRLVRVPQVRVAARGHRQRGCQVPAGCRAVLGAVAGIPAGRGGGERMQASADQAHPIPGRSTHSRSSTGNDGVNNCASDASTVTEPSTGPRPSSKYLSERHASWPQLSTLPLPPLPLVLLVLVEAASIPVLEAEVGAAAAAAGAGGGSMAPPAAKDATARLRLA